MFSSTYTLLGYSKNCHINSQIKHGKNDRPTSNSKSSNLKKLMNIFIKFILISLIHSHLAFPQVDNIKAAFKKFYNSEIIDPIGCNDNIQNFLKYLDENNIDYKDGHVIEVYEPVQRLFFYNARWGQEKLYQNGVNYFGSNWYFHVFFVHRNKVYDFSLRGSKIPTLKNYLNQGFLPKFPTKKLLFWGVITKKSTLKEFKKMKMKIFDPEAYSYDQSGFLRKGNFIDLF